MSVSFLTLLDVAPSTTMIGGIVAVSFLLLFIGVAVVAYKAMKRTVKMAFRMAIVGVILVIAVVGSATLWYLSEGGTPKLKPPADRPRR